MIWPTRQAWADEQSDTNVNNNWIVCKLQSLRAPGACPQSWDRNPQPCECQIRFGIGNEKPSEVMVLAGCWSKKRKGPWIILALCVSQGRDGHRKERRKERKGGGAAEPQAHRRRVQPWRWAMWLWVLALSCLHCVTLDDCPLCVFVSNWWNGMA